MCNRRLACIDGPDYAGYESVHYRKCLGLNGSGLMDSQRIFHVSNVIAISNECVLIISARQLLDSSCMEDYQTSGLAR